MAELSAKEYWLLKEIEEEFCESFYSRDPSNPFNYRRRLFLPLRKMDEMPWADIKDMIEVDKVEHKQSYWLRAISII